MPNTPNINLDIRIGGSSDPGWHNVLASDTQTTYGYCYTGGDDSAGGLIQIVNQGRDTAPIQLIAIWRGSGWASCGLPPATPSSASGTAFASERDQRGRPLALCPAK